MKESEKKAAVSKEPPSPPTPAIGDTMQTYFQRHGAFRAGDVFRVLGDPARAVTGASADELVQSKTK